MNIKPSATIEKTPLIAVLTGDVVGSQLIDSSDYDKMLTILEERLVSLSASAEIQYDIYRGDAYQVVFTDPARAVYGAVIIRLALRTASPSFEVRQSIGMGGASNLREQVKRSTGDAFVLSGKGLDQIKDNLLVVNCHHEQLQAELRLLTRFFDNHLSQLTKIQSQVLLCYLTSEDKSHAAIAKALNKTRTNVTRLLNACRYQLVMEYIQHFQQSVERITLHKESYTCSNSAY